MQIFNISQYFRPARWRVSVLLAAVLAGCGGNNQPVQAPVVQARTLAGGTVLAAAAQPSAADYYDVVQRIYVAYFGRPADPDGQAYWAEQFRYYGVPTSMNALVNSYDSNAAVRALVDSFGQSQESKDLYPGDNEQFIVAIYRNLFGREPDLAGKNYWQGMLDAGRMTRSFAALLIMAGAQADDITVINNKTAVAGNFTETLRDAKAAADYNGENAVATARALLGMVTPTTSLADFQPAVTAAATTVSPTVNTLVAGSAAVTDIKVQNTGTAAQTAVPVTFGQIFIKGQVQPKDSLAGKLADGTLIHLQMDIKALHDDGSVRHAVVTGILPQLGAGQTQKITIEKSTPQSAAKESSQQNLLATGMAGTVTLTIGGTPYTASLRDAMASTTAIRWLSGPLVSEWIGNAPLKSAANAVHPHLTARFGVRWYPGQPKQARIEVIIENNKTFAAAPQNFTYDVNVQIDGRDAYKETGLTHYHHSRWHKYLWWNPAGEPKVALKHNSAYLIASKAVPNYDQSIVPKESVLAALVTADQPAKTGPMKIGSLNTYMPTTGGRPDIGPLPNWSVMYLLTMDPRAKQTMMNIADGSGSWSVHYRDEATGFPIRLDNPVNQLISTHMNLAHKGPLPVPRCANNDGTLCATPYTADTAHQPSIAYLPYMVTGDYFYLEELQFWAAWNPTETDPGFQGKGLGLVRWQQLRGQAWSMRTLGHVAYITPDTHYMKQYFLKQLDNNLQYYTNTLVTANPNALGVYDGSGEGAFQVTANAPWQDDFFTWSFGYLAELGFTKAEPILRWKAKYPVGRMTAPGYCWTEASAYFLTYRDSMATPVYSSFAQLYAANYKNNSMTNDDSKPVTHPKGLNFLDQPCGSQAQADWRTAAYGYTWQKGQMIGYSSSEMGYPSNMQPALAVSATSGIPNARTAWTIFNNRAAKPDYTKGPQFAIIPR